MSIHRIMYYELVTVDGEMRCPECGARLNTFPMFGTEAPAFMECASCDNHWVDTVNMLRWLALLNNKQTKLFPGSDPNDLPKDNFASMLGGDDPDSGRHLRVDKLLQYIGDMLEA